MRVTFTSNLLLCVLIAEPNEPPQEKRKCAAASPNTTSTGSNAHGQNGTDQRNVALLFQDHAYSTMNNQQNATLKCCYGAYKIKTLMDMTILLISFSNI